jgi:hypothetical protein
MCCANCTGNSWKNGIRGERAVSLISTVFGKSFGRAFGYVVGESGGTGRILFSGRFEETAKLNYALDTTTSREQFGNINCSFALLHGVQVPSVPCKLLVFQLVPPCEDGTLPLS